MTPMGIEALYLALDGTGVVPASSVPGRRGFFLRRVLLRDRSSAGAVIYGEEEAAPSGSPLSYSATALDKSFMDSARQRVYPPSTPDDR